jgi:hypothetical protein
MHIKNNIKNHLINENINFIEFNTDPTSLKFEDTYHPYKLYDLNLPIYKIIQPLKNLYVFNTGILNRAGGINPTAVIFCHIEKHVVEDL